MAADQQPFKIREERAGDQEAIRRVQLSAFATAAEADLVDRLRQSCPERLSFVALDGDEVVGHVLFTPAIGQTGEDGHEEIKGMGLAPLAVLESHQRKGMGAGLSRHGIAAVKAAGYPFIMVLGHPEYYPRFGFERASQHGVRCEFPGVPDEAFMLIALEPSVVRSMSGVARYRPEFAL